VRRSDDYQDTSELAAILKFNQQNQLKPHVLSAQRADSFTQFQEEVGLVAAGSDYMIIITLYEHKVSRYILTLFFLVVGDLAVA
jgi:hypothetical protein